MNRFEGKTVWITGATSGIGEALAYAFADAGARLVLSGRREQKLDEVRLACARPQDHLIAPLDLADPLQIEQVSSDLLDQCSIDVLVNNGGISQRSLALETDLNVDRRIMEVNFFGAVALTKKILPSMVSRGNGQIVVVSSLAGKFGAPLRSAYAASKHALHGYFGVLRNELHAKGIQVTIVVPGFIRTSISKKALTKDGSEHGRMDEDQSNGLSPAECAEKIIRAVDHRQDEVLVGGRELSSVYIHRFFPKLMDRILRRRM